jgi:Fe-S-cluster containining protein
MKNSQKRTPAHRALPVLNGLSVASLHLDQDGDLTVTFDLPFVQKSRHYTEARTATRVLDVYKDPALGRLILKLFEALRQRTLARPDEDAGKVDCAKCKEAPCCRAYNVLITDEDIDRLRGAMPRRRFIAKYAVKGVDWSGDYRYQLACNRDARGEKCVFLTRDGKERMRCSVYAARPQICRDFDMRVCGDFSED